MTDLEQLANIIREHKLGKPNGGTATGSWITCSCGHTSRTFSDRDYAERLGREHIAQAIIDKGWTAPEILISHNHLTRDVKALGECPACDAYYIRR